MNKKRIDMKKWHILGMMILASVLLVSVIFFVARNQPAQTPADSAPVRYTYNIVKEYPHDTHAFTEGLVFEDGVLYESTGLWGESSIRRVNLDTGSVLQLYTLLDYQLFGEGITIFRDKIIQLTWRSNVGFVYDKDSFEVLREFNYQGEGWGITHDGSRLIMSNGTSTLLFLDPETFEKTGQIEVHYDNGTTVTDLNELEYVRGEVYANIWKENKIVMIDPQNGLIKAWIDLSGIPGSNDPDPDNVLNGIAYDPTNERLFVTGKRWSKLFEIELIAQNS